MTWGGGRLGEIVDLQRGNTYKSALLGQPGPVLLGLASIGRNGGFRSDVLRTYGGDSQEKLILKPGDLYVSLKDVTQAGDLLGAVARVPKEISLGRLTQDTVKLVFKRDDVSPAFLYWLLRTPQYRKYCRARAMGTTNLSLSRDDFLALPVPQEGERERLVTATLDALENKVQNHVRQENLLHQISGAIFQSWFVHFDPVRAKSEGRPPSGLDAETAALFPAEFEDSDLGEIPAGWSATTLADIVMERTGKVGAGNGHVILSAVASGKLKRSDEHFTKQVYSQDTSKYKRVEQWDYAYNPSRINIGSIGMLEEPIVGAVSPVYTVLRPAQGYEWFLRFFLDLPQTREVINQFCSGSVRQSLSFKDFAAIPVVLPPREIAEAFDRRWQELDALCQQLKSQSRQLAEVRDTLLPKLMSGELRVPESLMA